MFWASKDRFEKDIEEYLFNGEEVLKVYGLVKDFVAITNKRLLFVDKTMLSEETAVITIPFSRIESISIVKDKLLSFSNTIEISTKGKDYELNFIKGADVLGFYKLLSMYICR